MQDADFTVSLEDRYLLIRGVRSDALEKRAYHQMEIPFGEFVSEVELPSPVVVDEIEAVYQDGFLRIVFPKARPQQIRVEG
jgi:HSP20 family protein